MADSVHSRDMQHSNHGENLVDLNEFLEYYTYVSALYDADGDFDRLLSNTWNLDSNMNPSAIPYAGIPKRVTKVNTKERWLNDHHRAIIAGTEFDPVNPHSSSFPVQHQRPYHKQDPTMMQPAGKYTLDEYAVPLEEDNYAYEVDNYGHAPHKVRHEEIKEHAHVPRAFDYSKNSHYGSGSKSKTYESPNKPMETNFPDHHDNLEVASQHSGHSHHSKYSQHSQKSHHSNASHHSHASQHSKHSMHSQPGSYHNSQHSGHPPYYVAQAPVPPQMYTPAGYQQQPPNFYQPKQPEYNVHKNSRYY